MFPTICNCVNNSNAYHNIAHHFADQDLQVLIGGYELLYKPSSALYPSHVQPLLTILRQQPFHTFL